MDFNAIKAFAELLVALLGLAGTGSVVWAAWRGLRWIHRSLAQLQTNGGSSIKDEVIRLVEAQECLLKEVSVVRDDIFALTRTVALTNEIRQAISHLSDMALFQADHTGRCIWTSRAYRELVDREHDELCGAGWINAIDPKDRARVLREWEFAIKQGRNFEEEFSYLPPNGPPVLARVCAHPLHFQDELVGYFGRAFPKVA